MSFLSKIGFSKPTTKDGRKFRFGSISSLLITLCYAMTALGPLFAEAFPTAIYGIIAIYTVYSGGNVVNKAVLGKWQGATVVTSQQPPSEE